MLATQDGHTEALALLLANGANVNAGLQVIHNVYAISHDTPQNFPFVALTLQLKPEWLYFCYDRFTIWAY
jgi:hypothetical protein